MSFEHVDDLQYFQFESYKQYPLTQAIFTRHGGVSPEPWRSLNVGGTVGDHPAFVAENRKRVFAAAGRSVASAHDVWQVHSADFVHAEAPRSYDPPIKADIIITANPAVTLFMRFADCVPIYLYDPVNHALAMAHAGWLGTVRRAAQAAVMAMQQTFDSSPGSLVAGLGPSIGPDHYEVGSDVISQVSESLGVNAGAHILEKNGKSFLNLWTANRDLLQALGITQIEMAGICTMCRKEDWFSHRGENGKTGRFAAVFNLE